MSAVGRIGGVGRLGLVAAAVRQFDPRREFFSNGEQGVWHDTSDLSTLFQDSAGTVPVTAVEQPVGLMLDKRLGLIRGPEIILDPSFDDASKWAFVQPTSGSVSVSGGKLFISTLDGTYCQAAIFPFQAAVVGRYYEYVISVESLSGAGISVSAGSNGPLIGTSGVHRGVIFATSSGAILVRRFTGVSATSAVVTSISVRELPGNHAPQPTPSARPAYRATPQRVVFDGSDDVHTTTFPASLGSNCTIARAIPGVGASILTAQTVGTTFNNTITHAGMLIVDRALNAVETARLTAYLNAKAGV